MKYIKIVADTNDADYVESFNPISEEDLTKVMPIILAIKGFVPYKTLTEDKEMEWTHRNNYPINDCCRTDLGERSAYDIYVTNGEISEEVFELWDENFVPTNQYGIHSITSVKIIEVSNIKVLI